MMFVLLLGWKGAKNSYFQHVWKEEHRSPSRQEQGICPMSFSGWYVREMFASYYMAKITFVQSLVHAATGTGWHRLRSATAIGSTSCS